MPGQIWPWINYITWFLKRSDKGVSAVLLGHITCGKCPITARWAALGRRRMDYDTWWGATVLPSLRTVALVTDCAPCRSLGYASGMVTRAIGIRGPQGLSQGGSCTPLWEYALLVPEIHTGGHRSPWRENTKYCPCEFPILCLLNKLRPNVAYLGNLSINICRMLWGLSGGCRRINKYLQKRPLLIVQRGHSAETVLISYKAEEMFSHNTCL